MSRKNKHKQAAKAPAPAAEPKPKPEPKPQPEAKHEHVIVSIARRGDRHRIEVTLRDGDTERRFVPRTSGPGPFSKLRATGHVGDVHQLMQLWVSGRLDLTKWTEVTG